MTDDLRHAREAEIRRRCQANCAIEAGEYHRLVGPTAMLAKIARDRARTAYAEECLAIDSAYLRDTAEETTAFEAAMARHMAERDAELAALEGGA